jgi:hypothetical protein
MHPELPRQPQKPGRTQELGDQSEAVVADRQIAQRGAQQHLQLAIPRGVVDRADPNHVAEVRDWPLEQVKVTIDMVERRAIAGADQDMLQVRIHRCGQRGERALVADPATRHRQVVILARDGGEGGDPPARSRQQPRRSGGNRGTVEPGAQMGCDMVCAAQPTTHRDIQLLAAGFGIGIGSSQPQELPPRVPIAPGRHAIPRRDGDMAGFDPGDILEAGSAAERPRGDHLPGEVIFVRPARYLGEHVQALRHRGKGKEPRSAMVMERAGAERIPGQKETVTELVPQRESEIADQAIAAILRPARIRRQQDVRIAQAAGALGRQVQRGAQLLAIVEPDIGNQDGMSIRRVERLSVVSVLGQQPGEPTPQGDRAPRPLRAVIRSVDPLRRQHAVAGFRRVRVAVEPPEAGQGGHGYRASGRAVGSITANIRGEPRLCPFARQRLWAMS